MTPVFNCPACRLPLAEDDGAGRPIDITCARCRFKYRAVPGTLLAFHTVASSPPKLRILLGSPAGDVELVSYFPARFTSWLEHRVHRELWVVYTLRRDAIEELIEFQDRNDGDFALVGRPGHRARGRARLLAALSGGVTLAFLAGTDTHIALIAAASLAAAAYYATSRWSDPRLTLPEFQQTHLLRLQDLLERKNSVSRARSAAAADLNKRLNFVEQMTSLRDKMRSVGEAAYARRIQRLTDASRLLTQEATLDRRLIEGYDKVLTMIQIEMDAHLLEDSISDEATDMIDSKIVELDALKAAINDLEGQLAANEEVERFLTRTASDGALPNPRLDTDGRSNGERLRHGRRHRDR